MPQAFVGLYLFLQTFNFTGIMADPACIRSSGGPLASNWAQLGVLMVLFTLLAMLLVFLQATRARAPEGAVKPAQAAGSCCSTLQRKLQRPAETMSGIAIALLVVIYSTASNAVFSLLGCDGATTSVREYILMEMDGTALAAAGISTPIPTLRACDQDAWGDGCEEVLPQLDAPVALHLWRANPMVVCNEGAHVPAKAFALFVLAYVVLALPIVTLAGICWQYRSIVSGAQLSAWLREWLHTVWCCRNWCQCVRLPTAPQQKLLPKDLRPQRAGSVVLQSNPMRNPKSLAARLQEGRPHAALTALTSHTRSAAAPEKVQFVPQSTRQLQHRKSSSAAAAPSAPALPAGTATRGAKRLSLVVAKQSSASWAQFDASTLRTLDSNDTDNPPPPAPSPFELLDRSYQQLAQAAWTGPFLHDGKLRACACWMPHLTMLELLAINGSAYLYDDGSAAAIAAKLMTVLAVLLFHAFVLIAWKPFQPTAGAEARMDAVTVGLAITECISNAVRAMVELATAAAAGNAALPGGVTAAFTGNMTSDNQKLDSAVAVVGNVVTLRSLLLFLAVLVIIITIVLALVLACLFLRNLETGASHLFGGGAAARLVASARASMRRVVAHATRKQRMHRSPSQYVSVSTPTESGDSSILMTSNPLAANATLRARAAPQAPSVPLRAAAGAATSRVEFPATASRAFSGTHAAAAPRRRTLVIEDDDV